MPAELEISLFVIEVERLSLLYGIEIPAPKLASVMLEMVLLLASIVLFVNVETLELDGITPELLGRVKVPVPEKVTSPFVERDPPRLSAAELTKVTVSVLFEVLLVPTVNTLSVGDLYPTVSDVSVAP